VTLFFCEEKMKAMRILPALFLAATLAGAQVQPPIDPAMGISTLPLWPVGAPQIADTPSADQPTLTVFLPQKGKASGSAILIAPGGGYTNLSMNLEGRQVADWFASRGFVAFVLKYRLGAKYLYPIPLEDAQRAMRLVRSLAGTYNYSPDRVGMIGFSAGGHLAAATGTLFNAGKPDSADPLEKLSDRPDFLVLGYPWLNAMQPSAPFIWYCSVIKTVPPESCKANEEKYTPSRHVTPQTPTTFIYSTTDDKTVPVITSVEFYRALLAAGVPAEMHIFRHGGHGSGMGGGSAALDLWPVLLEQWLRDQGFLTPAP
jgi:acetyl esterase/lipase